MRLVALLIGTSMLAACGGTTTTISSGGTVAPPASGGGSSGGGVAPHTFVNPTVEKTYQANGAAHNFQYGVTVDAETPSRQIAGTGELYAGDASTVRQGGFTVNYNPRDAIFEVTANAPLGNSTFQNRFQDPAHRTAFGGLAEPQIGTPRLAAPGVQYLQPGSGSGVWEAGPDNGLPRWVRDDNNPNASYNVDTFFYQKPGTTTQYVTFAGFLRNNITASLTDDPTQPGGKQIAYTYNLTRGAFVFGEASGTAPRTGTGTYNGTMIATAVLNNLRDNQFDAPTYFQWIEGAASARVDFGANIFNLDLTGTVRAPQTDILNSNNYSIRSGATFTANGTGQIDMVHTGGFLGAFQRAWFVNPNGSRVDLTIAGSSYDGTFYGPNAAEIGGNFRIVGGVPDERIDILGAFIGR